MNNLKRSTENPALRSGALRVDQLSLYNQFGSMAYGIILQIIPQEHIAQDVLVDVFTSPQLPLNTTVSGNPLVHIVKIARTKALEARHKIAGQPSLSTLTYQAEELSPELIFNLSFHQGYSLDAIAEQFELSKPDVLKAIREYVKSFRQY